MSGILSTAERNRLIERLRKAATAATNCGYVLAGAISTKLTSPRQLVRVVKAWLDFPENCRDTTCPAPCDILRIIERLDQEECERKRLEEILKG